MFAGRLVLILLSCTAAQEDFEMAVVKVMKKDGDSDPSLQKLWK